MRKLKLQMHITLDGFVAGPNGEGDWVFIGEQDPAGIQNVIELADTCDTILLGRKMTKDFIPYWEKMVDDQPEGTELTLADRMVNMRKIVFSRTQTSIKGRNLEVENSDLVTAVQALKNQPGKDIIVYGGANFVSSLISHNLIDEYYLISNPISLGSGLSIFTERKLLKLVDTIIYKSGKIRNKYLPV